MLFVHNFQLFVRPEFSPLPRFNFRPKSTGNMNPYLWNGRAAYYRMYLLTKSSSATGSPQQVKAVRLVSKLLGELIRPFTLSLLIFNRISPRSSEVN